jgi:hypothetical protein
MSRPVSPDFDQRLADWLETDPNHAPATVLATVTAALPSIQQRRASRAPWRFPPMPRLAVLGAAAATIAILGLAGLVLVGAPTPKPVPTSIPSPTYPAPSFASRVTNLATTFSSPAYGYTIHLDPTWTVTPAAYAAGDSAATDANSSDLIRVTGTDTTIGVQAVHAGTPFDTWLNGVHQDVVADISIPDSCKTSPPSAWPAQSVGGKPGVEMALCNFTQVFVPVGGRVYTFTWQHDTFNAGQHLEYAQFLQVLDTVAFTTTFSGVDHLTRTFTSPLYGYSIKLDPSWVAKPATQHFQDPGSTEATVYDYLAVTGTDTTIGVAAEPIGKQTFAEYLAGQHAAVLKDMNVPATCRGSDPLVWPTVAVGDQEGREMSMCNYEVVFARSGPSVFQFEWGHDSFDNTQHLPVTDFHRILQTVTYP